MQDTESVIKRKLDENSEKARNAHEEIGKLVHLREGRLGMLEKLELFLEKERNEIKWLEEKIEHKRMDLAECNAISRFVKECNAESREAKAEAETEANHD